MFVARQSLPLALVLMLTSGVAFDHTATGQGLNATIQLVVAAAEISADGTTLFVSGVHFGKSPAVSLGGTLLEGVTVNPSGTLIAAPMPQLPAGSYLLHVATGNGLTQSATFVVTVGGQGPKGDKGDPGEKGDRGDAGPQGEKGDKGDKGDRGDAGPQGVQGERGERGEQGPQGVQGVQGVPGPQGEEGPRGLPGEQGPPGPQGLPGILALAGLTCGPGRYVRGFNANGEPLCTPTCGDGALESGEEFEGGPGPFSSAPVNASSCKFDFSNVNQLYCHNGCSWAGPTSCDVQDATVLCRLKTGNPNAFALTFEVRTASAAPGFACAASGMGTVVPNMAGRVTTPYPVRYENASLVATHGTGLVVTNVVCSQ